MTSRRFVAGRRHVASFVVAVIAAVLMAAPGICLADPSAAAAREIDLPIDRVAHMRTWTFIRNETASNSDEAANHLRDKYAYFRSDIQTAEDFIRLCGTRSEMTEQPYLVKTGSTARLSADFLTEELRRIRRNKQ